MMPVNLSGTTKVGCLSFRHSLTPTPELVPGGKIPQTNQMRGTMAFSNTAWFFLHIIIIIIDL